MNPEFTGERALQQGIERGGTNPPPTPPIGESRMFESSQVIKGRSTCGVQVEGRITAVGDKNYRVVKGSRHWLIPHREAKLVSMVLSTPQK
jgi:hypothetical protein